MAARAAEQTILEATRGWPREVAYAARSAAGDMVAAIDESLACEHTATRRKSLRAALWYALELASLCDVAMAHGLKSAAVGEALRCASRTLSMIGLAFHATVAAPVGAVGSAEREAGDVCQIVDQGSARVSGDECAFVVRRAR